MDEFLNRLFRYASNNWSSPLGLLVSMLFAFIILIVLFSGIDLTQITLGEIIVSLIILGIIPVFWKFTKLPKAKKNRIGIGIALQIEDDEITKNFLADLIHNLRSIQNNKYSKPLQLLLIPKSACNRITNDEEAFEITELTNVKFLLFGRVCVRKIDNLPNLVLNLRGLARHAQIDEERSKRFKSEFSRALPNFLIKSDNTLFAGEITAAHINTVVKYIVGYTAGFSGDYSYAEELLLDCETTLEQFLSQHSNPKLFELKEQILQLLNEIYKVWLYSYMERYRIARDNINLTQAEIILEKIDSRNCHNDSTLQAKALCLVMLHHDITQAKTLNETCLDKKRESYWYNMAFFHGYENDLDEANQCYKKILKLPVSDSSIPTQCEEFIQIFLRDHPQHIGLHFCSGIINFRIKEDKISARNDFEEFIKLADPIKFAKHIEIVKGWLNTLI